MCIRDRGGSAYESPMCSLTRFSPCAAMRGLNFSYTEPVMRAERSAKSGCRGMAAVYARLPASGKCRTETFHVMLLAHVRQPKTGGARCLSLIHISEPTRLL